MESSHNIQPEEHDDFDSVDLLLSSASAGIETPKWLASRIDRKIAGIRRRRWVVMSSSCVSVLLVAIAGIIVMQSGDSSLNQGGSNTDIVKNHDSAPDTQDDFIRDTDPLPPAAERVRVRFASNEQFITVPATARNPRNPRNIRNIRGPRNPNITIIQVYRAVPVARSDIDTPANESGESGESGESAGEPNTRPTDYHKEFIG